MFISEQKIGNADTFNSQHSTKIFLVVYLKSFFGKFSHYLFISKIFKSFLGAKRAKKIKKVQKSRIKEKIDEFVQGFLPGTAGTQISSR